MSDLYRDFIDQKADQIITDLGGTITPAPANAELYRDFIGRKFDEVITNLNGLAIVGLDELLSGYIVHLSSNVKQLRASACISCYNLISVNLPNVLIIPTNCFASCILLSLLDFPKVNTINANAFNGCNVLDTLILRNDSVVTLANINAFNSTQFANNGTGGKLYVPQSLIASYQSANNWDTILGYPNNQILAIEGSPYEN